MKTVEATIFSFDEGLTNRKMISLISNYNDTQFNVEIRDFYIDDKKITNSHPSYFFPVMVKEEKARKEYIKLKGEYTKLLNN